MTSDLRKAGKYEILELIGSGGFGTVYRGHDPLLKRQVAVKTCTSDNEETRRRFLREAEIAGGLQHPGITTVYDFGYEGEIPYIVQEFLSGEDLDHKITRRTALSLEQRVAILLRVARALGFAHEQGVTHRDIKPSNLRVLEDGRVKIMDFGIAKLGQADSQLTKTGTTLGTPAYLAPEQLRGDGADRRSDLYSFAAVGYELLSYRRPFAATTISTLFFQILHTSPAPLMELVPGCPVELDHLIRSCLNKDPTDRPAGFTEVIADLTRVYEALGSKAREPLHLRVPDEHELGALERAEQEQALTFARSQIEGLIHSGDLREAARALLSARQSFGENDTLQTLQERLLQAQVSGGGHDVATGRLEEVRLLIEQQRLAAAQEEILRLTQEVGEHPQVIALGRQVRLQRRIAEARDLLDQGDAETAEKVLRQAQELDPENQEVGELLAQTRDLGATRVLRTPPPSAQRTQAAVSGVVHPPNTVRRRALQAIALSLAITAIAFWLFEVLRNNSQPANAEPGIVLLIATPWAYVESITTGTDEAALLSEDRGPQGEGGTNDGAFRHGAAALIAPRRLRLAVGSYHARFSHPEFGEKEVSFEVRPGATTTVTAAFVAPDVDAFLEAWQ